MHPAPAPAPVDPGFRRLALAAGAITVAFLAPLAHLVGFARHNDMYSFTLLIPAIVGYLAWQDWPRRPAAGPRLAPGWAALVAIGAGGLLAAGLGHPPAARQDQLAFLIPSYSLLLIAAALLLLGRATLRHFGFPLALLLLLAPFTRGVEAQLEDWLRLGSSVVAQQFLELAGTPVFRDATFFHLPGFDMEVAPECSGLHSTLALFITSLVAGHLLLRSVVRRTVLALLVIPLALLRNGFRVCVIGELCVRISPDMIDSWIHHHGGPVFFALSLVPFSLILLYFIRSERPRQAAGADRAS